jgi:heterodisulfide reductase subunit A-like polyferredoxin
MRIGVYVCECGVNIGATVDVEKVAEYAKSLPYVVESRYYKYMCRVLRECMNPPFALFLKNQV